ncbi:MAG TPA: GNAT family N-acetyltransferase [Chloroflexota bacterium]
MSLTVRPITPDELAAWIGVTFVAFHNNRSAEPMAAYVRERLGDDTSRCLATVDGARLVGTYESFTAQLTLPGGDCVPANAVSAVSVLPSHHRRGALTRMLTRDLHEARERGEVASILIAAEYPIYGRFGFGPATDHAAYKLETVHAQFTASAPGCVDLVEPAALRPIAPSIFDRVRGAYPGQIDRPPFYWDTRLGVRPLPWRNNGEPPRLALYTAPSGEPEGYLVYHVESDWVHHVPGARLEIEDLQTVTDEAYLGLWRYMAEVDLLSEVTVEMRRVDEPLRWMLADARKALHQTMRNDFLWLRTLDTPRLLAGRRYAVEDRLVLAVDDPLGIAGGRFALEGGPEGATCRATDAAADLSMSMLALGAISLGGVSLHTLHAAGRIQEEQAGALAKAEHMFRWPIAPWCSTFF